MKVKSISLENFRSIIKHKVYFDSSLTVFAGRNGGGKSTILEALAIMLSWFPVQMGEGVQAEKIKDKDITHGRDYSKLALEVESEGRLMTLTMSKHLGRSQGAQTEGMSDALDYGRGVRVSMEGGSGIDTELPVIFIKNSDGTPKGAIYAFACHQDCVGGLHYSGDFSSEVSKQMKKTYGEDFVTVFFEGTAGNINHFNVNTAEDAPDHYRKMGRKIEWKGCKSKNNSLFFYGKYYIIFSIADTKNS